VNTIRAIDSKNIIVIGTPNWSQDVDDAARNPVEGNNLAYALHFYAASHKGELRAKATTALSLNKAIFVTEWGTGAYDGNGYFDQASSTEWIKFMDDNRISWCNWSITNKDETTAAFKTTADVFPNSWTAASYSTSGAYVRNKLRSYPANSTGGDVVNPDDIPVTDPSAGLSGDEFIVEAESFDAMSGIQTEYTSDGGSGSTFLNIAYIENKDWVQYALHVKKPGKYTMDIRYASNHEYGAGGSITVAVNGVYQSTVGIPVTGNWQTWSTRSTVVVLKEGSQSLKLTFAGDSGPSNDKGLMNLNWYKFSLLEVDPSWVESLDAPAAVYANGNLAWQQQGNRIILDQTNCQIFVFDLRGNRRMEWNTGESSLVNLEALPAGSYLVRVQNAAGYASSRLIHLF
jgi:endoglucanase